MHLIWYIRESILQQFTSHFSQLQPLQAYISALYYLTGIMSGYKGTGTTSDLNNHANQGNPNHPTYQGYTSGYPGTGTRADLGNHSNQTNPNSSAYQASVNNRSNQMNPNNSRYQGPRK